MTFLLLHEICYRRLTAKFRYENQGFFTGLMFQLKHVRKIKSYLNSEMRC